MDLTGRRLGFGTANGANPNSPSPELGAEQVAAAVRAALADAGCRPDQVAQGVLGLAGASRLADKAVALLYDTAWHSLGLRCAPRIVTDYEVAFAAGTAEPSGTVLVAGTGSVAARIVDHRQVAIAGGYGWLLGDEGSAFWLGRQAVRGTLDMLRTGAALGPLARSVLAEALSPQGEPPSTPASRHSIAAHLITAATGAPPIGLARLAPLVSAAFCEGDPLAEQIVEDAVDCLVRTVRAVRSPDEQTPIVMIGSLVSADVPLGERLRRSLGEAFGGAVERASDGAAGAAWLAALDQLGSAAERLRAPLFTSVADQRRSAVVVDT